MPVLLEHMEWGRRRKSTSQKTPVGVGIASIYRTMSAGAVVSHAIFKSPLAGIPPFYYAGLLIRALQRPCAIDLDAESAITCDVKGSIELHVTW